MHESDYAHVLNDPTLTLTTSDGQTRTVIPFRPSMPSALPIHQHRPAQNIPLAPSAQSNTAGGASSSSRPGVFIPVSPAQRNHVETTIPRPVGNSALTAPLREATFPELPSKPIPVTLPSITSSQSQLLSQFSQPVVNGVARPAINVPYVVKTEPVVPSSASSTSPQRVHQESASAQNQEGGGEQKPIVNGVAQPPLVNGHTTSNPDKSTSVSSNGVHLPTTTDMKLKLPPVRQTPKSSNSSASRGGIPIQRPPSSLGGNAKVI